VTGDLRFRACFVVLAAVLLFACREQLRSTPIEAAPLSAESVAENSASPLEERSEGSKDCAIHPLQCNADYLSFPSRFPERGKAVENCDALTTRILAAWDRPNEPLPEVEVGASFDLREALLDALNIRFLKDAERGWMVGEVAVEELAPGPGYRQQRLRFRDPHLGVFGALLLLPEAGAGPYPAVLALPGHNETPEDHRDRRHGALLAQRGFAVLVPALRAYDSREAEHEATVALLCQGFSLLGLRVYEALVALRYLAEHAEVDADRVGLLGHSGGSATLNLVVRLTSIPRALVTDTATGYLNVQEGPFGKRFILDETHFAVAAMAEPINQFATAGCPVLQVPYGAPDGPEPILEFLDKSLSSSPR